MGPLGYHQVSKNSHYKGARKREREGYKNVVEKIMFENFPKLKMETDTKYRIANKITSSDNTHTPRHSIIKMAKVKDREF